MKFSIPIELPSGKKIRVPELKNRHYFDIIKFCTNDDLEGLGIYLKELLFEEFKISKDLGYLDIIYTIIYIRMIFVGASIYVQNQQGSDINIGLDVFLEKIEKLEPILNQTFSIDGIQIEIGMPSEIYFDNIDNLFISTIRNITYNNNTINFCELSVTEQHKVLSTLPARAFNRIKNYIEQMNSKLGTILLVEENPAFDLSEIKINVFSNQFLLFIKSIFSQNLRSFFELVYHYCNKIAADYSLFMDLSPVDSHIILNFFKEEVKQKNEELKKNNS